MKTKIAIFNDRKIEMQVRIMDKGKYDHNYHEFDTLKPASMGIFEIEIPDDSIPYFKVWENNVAFLSFIGDKK